MAMVVHGARMPTANSAFLGEEPSFARMVQENVRSLRPSRPQAPVSGRSIGPKLAVTCGECVMLETDGIICLSGE